MFPTTGAGSAFNAGVAAFLAGCLTGERIIGRALGTGVAGYRRGNRVGAGFAARAAAGRPTGSAGISAFIAGVAADSGRFLIVSIAGSAGAGRCAVVILGRTALRTVADVAGFAVFSSGSACIAAISAVGLAGKGI